MFSAPDKDFDGKDVFENLAKKHVSNFFLLLYYTLH